jgi:plastocyanin
MAIFRRDVLVKLSALGMIVIAAGCGGDNGGDAATEDTTSAPAAAAPAPPAPAPAATPAAGGRVIEVRMVTTQGGASGEYQPAQVNARVGDTIRFINDGGAAHNASFPADQNAGASGLPGPGPLLTQANQTYDVPVTFGPGTYNFQCDPHALLGMKGTLTVTQ